MTIYYIAGELAGFVPSSSAVEESVTANYYDGNFARAGIFLDNETEYIETPSIANLTTAWLHWRCALEGQASASTSTGDAAMIYYDGSGTARVRLFVQPGGSAATSNTWQMQYDVGSGWTNAGSSFVIGQGEENVDLNAVVNTASGSLAIYLGGTLRASSGTVDLSAITALNKVRFYGRTQTVNYWQGVSEVVVANEPTIGFRVATLYPSGTGANTDWSGTYANIDETVTNDADVISATTNNWVSMFTTTSVASSLTGYVVRAIAVDARAKKGASGPSNLNVAVRVGSTNYFSSNIALSTGYTAACNVWETDPSDSGSWLTTDIPLQIGVRAIT